MNDKRLTIEIKTEEEKSTIRDFKGECAKNGMTMREKIFDLIRQFLKG